MMPSLCRRIACCVLYELLVTRVLLPRPQVIVYNYPKSFKAFYMKQNDDGKTVQAMDVLVPGVRGCEWVRPRLTHAPRLNHSITSPPLLRVSRLES